MPNVQVVNAQPDHERRLTMVELQQDVHAKQLDILTQTVEALRRATDKLTLRLTVGVAVIFAGTENGADLVSKVVTFVAG